MSINFDELLIIINIWMKKKDITIYITDESGIYLLKEVFIYYVNMVKFLCDVLLLCNFLVRNKRVSQTLDYKIVLADILKSDNTTLQNIKYLYYN